MEKRAGRMLYFEPNFVDEALVLLDRFGTGARLLAGGTRLGPALRGGSDETSALINLKRIDAMQGIEPAAAHLRIGALTTAAQLARDPHVRKHARVLADAAASLGARQLRSVATLGGNVCCGDPLSDLSAALLACDARCEVATLSEGPALVALEQLVARSAPLAAGELLTAVEIPVVADARFSYQKMLTRRAFELAVVAVAVRLTLQGDRIADARIALAGAGEVTLRALNAEAALRAAAPTAAMISGAARIAAIADARPQDDARASARYRRQLVDVLTQRALHAALGGA
ncbi:MAG: FAD binding domain-containing protein [Candidatus Eremiobacteraeota bacterium]|nr:FAD binding domain-containing protein [Candidatus Eremiobacteraeota bacterium]